MGIFSSAFVDEWSLRPLKQAQLDSGLGNLIHQTLIEHEGKMLVHELLTVLIRRGRTECVFDSLMYQVEFVVGPEGLPELKVYPGGGETGWLVKMGGPRCGYFRQIFDRLGKGAQLSAVGGAIRCNKGLLFQRSATLVEINDLLGARIFDPNYSSSTLEKEEI